MPGTIFGKLYGFVLEKITSRWAEGQACLRVGRFILDHILTLCTLIEQEIFVGR